MMRIVTKKKQVRSKGNLEAQVQELRDIFAGEGTLGHSRAVLAHLHPGAWLPDTQSRSRCR